MRNRIVKLMVLLTLGAIPAFGQSSIVQVDSIYFGRYDAFGFTVRFPNGKYGIIYRDAISHASDTGQTVMQLSTNGGITWSAQDSLQVGYPPYTNSTDSTTTFDGQNGLGYNGRLIIGYAKYDPVLDTTLSINVTYSDDEGRNFSTPFVVSGLTQKRQNFYGGLIKIANGKLLLPFYDLTHSTLSYYVKVMISSNNGLTWSTPITVITSSIFQPTEASFVYLGDCVIVGLIRQNNSSKLRQVKSTDNGSTWIDQGDLIVASGENSTFNTMADVRTYMDGGHRMVVAYFFDRNNSRLGAIYGLADNVKNGVSGWDASKKVYISPKTRYYRSGYPSIIHPDDTPQGFGWYYDENFFDSTTTIRFVYPPFFGNTITRSVVPTGTNGQMGWTIRNGGIVSTATSTDTLQAGHLRAGTGSTYLHIGPDFLSAIGFSTIRLFDNYSLENSFLLLNIGNSATDFTSGGGLNLAGRFNKAKGTDVASNDTLTLGNSGNYFIIMGTDSLKWITTTNWSAGSEIVLEFQSTPVLVHNAPSPPTSSTGLRLAGSVNKTATAGMVIRFHYNGTVWRQSAPTVEF